MAISTIGCTTFSSKQIEARYSPSEGILETVAVLRRHVPDNTYRFPPANDFTGRNVYRAALLRLESLQRAEVSALQSGYMDDVIAFAKARSLERLRAYGWPGNVRELREQIRAAVRLARGDELGPEDLLLAWESSENIPAFRDAKRAFEHEYVTRVLRICRGNISRAARIAKKDRKDFYDVIRRNSINPQDFRR